MLPRVLLRMPFALDRLTIFNISFPSLTFMNQNCHADVLFAPRTLEDTLFIQLDRGMTTENVIFLLYRHHLVLFQAMPSCSTCVKALKGAGRTGYGEGAIDGPQMNRIDLRDPSPNVDGYTNINYMLK